MSNIAEQSVIGALLIDNQVINEIYNDLKPDMFSNKVLRLIYTEFLKGFDNNYPVDIVTIDHNLKNANLIDGELISEIKNCMSSVFTSTGIKKHAEIIISDYKSEKLKDILSKYNSSNESINAKISSLIQELELLQGTKSEKSKSLSQIVKENKDKYFCNDNILKIYTGFPTLDDYLGGLEGGDVIVIGARPAVGKSSFVTQIAKNLSKQGKRVGYYNLEMKEKQMYERLAAAESGIDITRIRRATRFLGDEKNIFDKANENLENLENLIITTGSRSASQIKAECKYMGYDIVIIDYLQLLISEGGYKNNRYAEVGQVSRMVKSIAMELNVPVIILSQLNRVSTIKGNNEPTTAELRESGDIEQDASIIILLWNLNDDGDKKGCKVAKNRQGTNGYVVMKFDGSHMNFKETNEDINSIKNTYDISPFD